MAATVAAALATMAPLVQQQHQFEARVRLANELHDRSVAAANDMHREEQALEFALHKRGLALDRELHYGAMSHTSDIARREAVRDIFSQKSQLVQTLMIVDTLMFSCAAAIFCEGDLAPAASVHLARAYAATLGVAMGLLVVSVWLSMQVQARMARYDMYRPKLMYVCGRAHRDFNGYFRCHCKTLERASFITFVIGTAATVASGGMYTTAAMYYTYSIPAAAWVFAALAAAGVVVSFAGLTPTAAGSADDTVDVGGLAGADDERAQLRRQAAALQAVSAQHDQQRETAEVKDAHEADNM